MTNQSPASITYSKINKLITSSRFNEAFLMVKSRMKKFPDLAPQLGKLEEAEKTYRYMLDYLAEGNHDPSRDDVLLSIITILNDGNSALLRRELMQDSPEYYYSVRRLFDLRKTRLADLFDKLNVVLAEDQDKISFNQALILDEIFNFVWTMNNAPQEDYDVLSSALGDNNYPEYLKALLISAILLGGLSYFDSNSYEILLDYLDNTPSNKLQARLIVALLLLALMHPQAIKGNLSIKSRLMLLLEDNDKKELINGMLLKLIRTYDTKRIDNKMRNEVIPGLMKINPEILDKMRNLASDSENFLSDENPEWQEMIENSEIGDKLQEINDLQLEGADVMVTAFSNLKSFPFFNQISAWFLPFVPGHYEFQNLGFQFDEEVSSRFSIVMCDSDLNSFMLSMKSMPEQNRQQMVKNMEIQMKEAKEYFTNSIGETEDQKLNREILHYLRDIYRFFKFYRKKNEFSDPFAYPFTAKDIRPLMDIMGLSTENVNLSGEFYFKNKYFEEAAGIFELMETLSDSDTTPHNWEKIGYSYDRLGNFEKAIDYYRRADIINPGNLWLEKKLAVALKNSGKTKEALEYYNKALEKEPENYHLLMSAAQCMLDDGDLDGAKAHLYHADYLKPGKIQVKRALAWTELMARNFEKANLLYRKILDNEKVTATDFLNAAHASLANNDFKSALNLYKNFVEMSENKDITNLLLALKEDAETLKSLDIRTKDLRLIVDKIRYDAM